MPSSSADGSVVAFESNAGNLDPDIQSGFGDSNVDVRNLSDASPKLVSVNHLGSGGGNSDSDTPVISADGNVVVFVSSASDLVEEGVDANGETDVYHRNVAAERTTLVSVNKDGTGSGDGRSSEPVLNDDGTVVAFVSRSRDLIEADRDGLDDVFAPDLTDHQTHLLSSDELNLSHPVLSFQGEKLGSQRQLSGDGRYLVFATVESLSPLDASGTYDVYLRDRYADALELISVNRDGTGSGDSLSETPVISADGSLVAFVSNATDLDSDGLDDDRFKDVYVRNVLGGTTNGKHQQTWHTSRR